MLQFRIVSWLHSFTSAGPDLSWIFALAWHPLACKRGAHGQISLSYSSIQQSADTSTCNLPRIAALHLLANVYISQTCRQHEHSMRVATTPSLHPRLEWTANIFSTPPFLRPRIHRLFLQWSTPATFIRRFMLRISDCVCGPARLRVMAPHFPVFLRLYVPSCLQVVGYSPEFPEATLSHAHGLLLVECSLLASVTHTRALPWLAAPHSILLVPLSRPCVLPCRHLATPLHTRDHAALATSSNCLATFTDLAPIKDVPYPGYRLSPATLPLPMTTTSRCYITLHRPRLHPFPGWRPRRRPLLLGPVTQHGMTPFRA